MPLTACTVRMTRSLITGCYQFIFNFQGMNSCKLQQLWVWKSNYLATLLLFCTSPPLSNRNEIPFSNSQLRLHGVGAFGACGIADYCLYYMAMRMQFMVVIKTTVKEWKLPTGWYQQVSTSKFYFSELQKNIKFQFMATENSNSNWEPPKLCHSLTYRKWTVC